MQSSRNDYLVFKDINMKTILLLTSFICFISLTSYANDKNMERSISWITDSYHYGKTGNICSGIYYNYGTDKWTFNSDEPELLKKLFEACKAGEEDRITGQSRLPELLDSYHRQK